MHKFHGLEKLCGSQQGFVRSAEFARLLMTDLAESQLIIYGKDAADHAVTLAVLSLITDDVQYDSFDKRLDLFFEGEILADSSPALTYCLQGQVFSVTGRCSTFSKVCGVDLYLSRSYTNKVGDRARQRFSIWIKALK